MKVLITLAASTALVLGGTPAATADHEPAAWPLSAINDVLAELGVNAKVGDGHICC